MLSPTPVPARSTTPILVASDLVRKFRSVTAVDGVSLQVGAGEILALLGPNGSGKSTTMSMLAGVIRPTSGTITVAGHSLQGATLQAKQNTGFVPDVGGLFPRLTGWEHLELAARLWGMDSSWQERARELLTRLDLLEAADRRASTYSKGMTRRLSVVIALLSRPRLLLLDEPFDGVDPTGSESVLELILEAAAQGSAVVVSTHLMDVAERVCDQVAVLARGRVLAYGPLDELGTESSSLAEAYLQTVRSATP